MNRLSVAGVALHGSGYPNAARTIAILVGNGEWEVHDHAHWLPPDTHLWRLAKGSLLQKLGLALRLGVFGLVQALQVILHTPAHRWVYVPYPAPVMLWWLSFCPARWRPRCIADAYISIWDSMFRDRRQADGASLGSRLVHVLERRSLRVASCVLVDTEANRLQMIQDFDLESSRVASIPLAIEEDRFLDISPKQHADGQPLRVVFVGTLIPLHGIEVVLDAIEQLAGDARFEFRLVGDGQLGAAAETFVERTRPDNFTWLREWRGLEQVAAEIADADICLGVFAGDGKSSRVLPFKLYMYLAGGRAVISQAALSVPSGVPAPPVRGIDPSLPGALAQALCELAGNPGLREALGRKARSYYLQWLCNARVADAWRELLQRVK